MPTPSPGQAPTPLFDPSGYRSVAPVWTHDAGLDGVLLAGRALAVDNLADRPCPIPDLP